MTNHAFKANPPQKSKSPPHRVPLTKADIIDSIHHRLGLPKARSIQVTETLLEIIKQTLASGEDVLISGEGDGGRA